MKSVPRPKSSSFSFTYILFHSYKERKSPCFYDSLAVNIVTQQSELGLIRPIIIGDSQGSFQFSKKDRGIPAKAKLSKIWPLERIHSRPYPRTKSSPKRNLTQSHGARTLRPTSASKYQPELVHPHRTSVGYILFFYSCISTDLRFLTECFLPFGYGVWYYIIQQSSTVYSIFWISFVYIDFSKGLRQIIPGSYFLYQSQLLMSAHFEKKSTQGATLIYTTTGQRVERSGQ